MHGDQEVKEMDMLVVDQENSQCESNQMILIFNFRSKSWMPISYSKFDII